LRNPEVWLLQLDYASSKSSAVQAQQSHRRDQAIDLLVKVLWEISDIRFIPGEDVRPKPRVEFKTPYGWVPFRQLGYGYQSLATWVADFASRMVERYPESKNPLTEPAVVLVDEIDLHLHPKWQRELMDRLTNLFPNTQFIATAHSPLVVQAAANANLAVLRRVGDHVEIDNDVDYIRNWRVDQILTSDLFGLDSARPPHIAKLIAERDKLLAKTKLSKADEKKIEDLEAEIGELPIGETKQQQRMMDDIQQSLDLLKRERLSKK
jgi:predicted ATP-binding protein involved in virulence